MSLPIIYSPSVTPRKGWHIEAIRLPQQRRPGMKMIPCIQTRR